MAISLPADNIRSIVTGIKSSWNETAGTPTSSKLIYGTMQAAEAGEFDAMGILTSFSVSTTGEKKEVKDETGATFLESVHDPGFAYSGNLLWPSDAALPVRGKVYTFTLPGDAVVKAAILWDFTINWEQEGWRSLTIQAGSKESMQGEDLYSATIKGTGAVGSVIQTFVPA